MAYLATFSDGYKRTIAGPYNTEAKAKEYALHLEQWFADGGYNRKLVDIKHKAL
jgi:hypothetical protein